MAAPKDPDGIPLLAEAPRLGDEVIYASHNFADPTTWFSESARATNEAATDSGNGLLWNLAHPNVINLRDGQVMDEDAYCADVDHGYAVVVTSDGVSLTQREPFATSGGDYVVNYAAGTITFAVSQAGKDVRVSYSYAQGSGFYVQPDDGYRIDIESAEAQFSDDAGMTDTVSFTVEGFVEVFAPQLAVSNGGQIPDGTRIPLMTQKYKRFVNFVDEAMGAYPVVPAIGGPRGFAHAIYGFPFRYGTVRRLQSSLGLRIRCYLETDSPFTGEHATATFYCAVSAE